MNIQSGVMKYLRQITVEPVFFLVFVNFGLIAISNQDLYLKKACLVNLNYTEEVCDNLQNQTDVQTEVQKYVSQIQAYNGLLQSAPGVILALFAGPLTDTFGKGPYFNILHKMILVKPVNFTIFFEDIHELLKIMSFMYHYSWF